MSMASCRYARIIGRSWCSVSALNTSACDRTAGGRLGSSRGSIRARASGTSPASIRKPAPTNVRRTRAASSSGGVRPHGLGCEQRRGVGRSAGAAASAARSTTSAISSSGVDVASARCRASCSRSSTRLGRVQVHGPTASGRHAEVHGCSEQRVREAHDAVAADGDRPGGDGFVHERFDVGLPERLSEQGRRRALDRRDELEQRPRSRPEAP